MSDNNMTDAEVLRQLDEANKYRDIIIDVLPRITQDAADDMSLRIRDYVAAQLAERDAEIAALRQQVAELQAQIAAGETERKELHQLVIELQDKIDFNRTGRIP